MPKSITCRFDGEIISINLAVAINKEYKNKRPDFRCVECGEPVRAHDRIVPSPHFEHLKKMRSAGLVSDKMTLFFY